MTPANDNRPAEFDRQLAAAYPRLLKRATFYTRSPNDLANETMLQACRHWAAFRQTPGNPYYGFATWLQFLMRSVAGGWKRKRDRRIVTMPMEYAPDRITQPPQEASYDLNVTLAILNGRDRDVLLRKAFGETGPEIAVVLGISRQRVSQIEAAARAKLMAAAANDNGSDQRAA